MLFTRPIPATELIKNSQSNRINLELYWNHQCVRTLSELSMFQCVINLSNKTHYERPWICVTHLRVTFVFFRYELNT